jgi:PPE-repeat protein
LIATNFFGINTIPIALNEADYLRMWLEAATTMTAYQGVSEESLAAVPPTPPAPQIVSAAATPAASSFPDPTKLILQALQGLLDTLRNLAAHTLTGPLGGPVVQALDSLISLVSSEAFTILAYSVLDPMIYFGPFTPLLSPLALPVGLVGLAGLAGLGADSGPVVADWRAPEHQKWPAAAGITLAGSGAAAPVAAPAGAAGSAAAPGSPTVPAPSGTEGFYVVGGGPDGDGFAPTGRTGAAAALGAGAAAPAATVPADSDLARAKRTAKARQRARKYRVEYLEQGGRATLSAGTPEAVVASEGGSGPLGFAGTVPKSAAGQAQGLISLRGAEFDAAPPEPMLPNTWDPE